MASERVVPIVLLLREKHRSAAAIERVKRELQKLKISPTTEGAASICGRISEAAFADLFHTAPRSQPAKKPSAQDAGIPAGYQQTELAVPPPLLEWVESISVISPATRMGSQSLNDF